MIIDYSWARPIVGNARTEIKERIRRETRYDGVGAEGGGRGGKKRNPRASTYTCISGKLAPPTESNPRPTPRRDENISRVRMYNRNFRAGPHKIWPSRSMVNQDRRLGA